MNDIVVIVPIYKNSLSKAEKISLQFCVKYLNRFDIIVISPESLKKDEEYLKMLEHYSLTPMFFKDSFFTGLGGYNKLMTNLNFYESFTKYEYMLICQLDTLVFSSDLSYWISKDYDYVGSPWIADGENKILDSMGNGGLSLRKISKFIEVLKSKDLFFSNDKFFNTSTRAGIKELFVLELLSNIKKKNFSINFKKFFLFFTIQHEDYFWTFYAKFFVNNFKLSTVEDALKFAFENDPSFCFKQNNNELPFGCHAWGKFDIDFWVNNVEELSLLLKQGDD